MKYDCLQCGAIVGEDNTELHRAWHEAQDTINNLLAKAVYILTVPEEKDGE